VNPVAFDFRLKSQSVVRKINFIPFDYSQAGVYGSDEWRDLARFDKALEKKFDLVVEKMEKIK